MKKKSSERVLAPPPRENILKSHQSAGGICIQDYQQIGADWNMPTYIQET